MAIHKLEQRSLTTQIAVGRLAAHQKLQAAANVFAVRPAEVGMTRSKESQQRQSGHAGVGASAGILPAAAEHVRILAGVVRAWIPTAVGGLIVGQPF